MTTRSLTNLPTWQVPRISPRLAVLGVLLSLTIMGAAAGVARLFAGMGTTTSLNDVYPWGIWIGFDFALIALSGAGFTMAAAVHILHLHQFAPALRPALFAGLLGYVAVLLLLVLDLGRPDRFYHFILYWNIHSPLFEISWCVLLYTTVLVIELAPDIFAQFGWHRLQRIASAILPPACIIGVTLSSLHQSTLGTLYVNMPHRLHPLWYTPYQPILFFISSVMVGLSVGILAYRIAACIHRRCTDIAIPRGLAWGISVAALLYTTLRLGIVIWEGKFPLALSGGLLPTLFWVEIGLSAILPLLLFGWGIRRPQSWLYWVAPASVALGIGMNRFNATLAAQMPAWNGVYVPHLLEWISTFGILSGALLAWLLAVRFFVNFNHTGHH